MDDTISICNCDISHLDLDMSVSPIPIDCQPSGRHMTLKKMPEVQRA